MFGQLDDVALARIVPRYWSVPDSALIGSITRRRIAHSSGVTGVRGSNASNRDSKASRRCTSRTAPHEIVLLVLLWKYVPVFVDHLVAALLTYSPAVAWPGGPRQKITRNAACLIRALTNSLAVSNSAVQRSDPGSTAPVDFARPRLPAVSRHWRRENGSYWICR